jgi:hypothetical protein
MATEVPGQRHQRDAERWPMNAPKQTTLTASQGAQELALITAGLGGLRKILL